MKAQSAAYYQRNKETVKRRVAEYRKANPSRTKEQRKRERVRNLGTSTAWRAKWYPENGHKVRARVAAHRKEKPEFMVGQRHARRARMLAATGDGISARQWKTIQADALGLCAYCNVSGEKLTLDHIDPLTKGGEHDVTNAAACCANCNSSKHDSLLIVWLARQRATTLQRAA